MPSPIVLSSPSKHPSSSSDHLAPNATKKGNREMKTPTSSCNTDRTISYSAVSPAPMISAFQNSTHPGKFTLRLTNLNGECASSPSPQILGTTVAPSTQRTPVPNPIIPAVPPSNAQKESAIQKWECHTSSGCTLRIPAWNRFNNDPAEQAVQLQQPLKIVIPRGFLNDASHSERPQHSPVLLSTPGKRRRPSIEEDVVETAIRSPTPATPTPDESTRSARLRRRIETTVSMPVAAIRQPAEGKRIQSKPARVQSLSPERAKDRTKRQIAEDEEGGIPFMEPPRNLTEAQEAREQGRLERQHKEACKYCQQNLAGEKQQSEQAKAAKAQAKKSRTEMKKASPKTTQNGRRLVLLNFGWEKDTHLATPLALQDSTFPQYRDPWR